ncbi:DUF1559 domain-containing protein [Lentisphaerota bacterium WC36G]|nr:DUF1559 domain-containing protein [Lentisphaerae bacterium WC36]
MKSKKFFNFTELIVVITVIIIALMFLFPFLTGHQPYRREKARQIACASNLKQIGTGICMYALENDDKLPAATLPKEKTFDGNKLLKKYKISDTNYFAGTNLAGTSAGNFEELRLSGILKDAKIYKCPSSIDTTGTMDIALKNDEYSYAYAVGLVVGSSLIMGMPDSGVVADVIEGKNVNHENYGNTLFLDAHVMGQNEVTWYKNSGMWQNKAPTKMLQTTDEMFNDSTLHPTPTVKNETEKN